MGCNMTMANLTSLIPKIQQNQPICIPMPPPWFQPNYTTMYMDMTKYGLEMMISCCNGMLNFPVDKVQEFLYAKGLCCNSKGVNFCSTINPKNGKLNNC